MPNIGNPPWLQELQRSNRFVIGAPRSGVYTGRPVVVLAYPVHGRDSRGDQAVTGAVELVVNLTAFQPLVSASLPPGGVAGIIDGDANMIARSVRPKQVVGKNFRGTEVNDLVLRKKAAPPRPWDETASSASMRFARSRPQAGTRSPACRRPASTPARAAMRGAAARSGWRC
jgi:hypothetical protein